MCCLFPKSLLSSHTPWLLSLHYSYSCFSKCSNPFYNFHTSLHSSAAAFLSLFHTISLSFCVSNMAAYFPLSINIYHWHFYYNLYPASYFLPSFVSLSFYMSYFVCLSLLRNELSKWFSHTFLLRVKRHQYRQDENWTVEIGTSYN